MAVQLTTTREAAAMHGVKVLVYGRAGMGKTTLCATAPDPVILSAESGLLSLRKYDIPVITIRNIEDLEDAYAWATSSREADPFATLCLDSITEIAEQVLSAAKEVYKDPRQAYGELSDRVRVLIKKFRDISGKHVYMAAKQAYIKDEETGKRTFGVSMPGQQLPQAVPYLFDEVFCLNMGKDEEGEFRYLMTQPTIQYDAKDRSGALLANEVPDLSVIFTKILEEEAAKAEA